MRVVMMIPFRNRGCKRRIATRYGNSSIQTRIVKHKTELSEEDQSNTKCHPPRLPGETARKGPFSPPPLVAIVMILCTTIRWQMYQSSP